MQTKFKTKTNKPSDCNSLRFVINHITWNIKYVKYNSKYLHKSDGTFAIGATDWDTNTIYLNNKLSGGLLYKVICHEIVHCFSMSYQLNIDAYYEEYLANFIAEYGKDIVGISKCLYERRC